MSLGTNTVKLHQVYLALDCHQYSKAVKLASALPPDHVLGKALLAHALQRSGQRYKSLCVIQTLLGKSDWYYELDYELKRCVTAANTESSAGDSSNATTASSAAPNQNPSSSSSSSSKKKKGKKQGKAGGGSSSNTTLASSTNAQSTKNTTAVTHVVPDLVSWLQQPRITPENWDTVPPTGNDVIAITDETTLATIAVTLQATRLYVTIYQMYAVASNALTGGAPLPPKMKPQDVNTIVTKSFLSGLHLLLEENFPTSQALASMQITAMQLARLASANDKAPLWAAARTALWQLDFLRPDDEKASQKQLMLPRLAESLASKAIGIDANNITEADGGTTTAASAEEYFVFLETLKRQGKLEESLQLLQTLEDVTLSTKSTMAQPGTIPLSIRQIRELKAELLIQMDRHNDAAEMYEVLITEYVDQWSYWIAYLDCINQSSHAEEAVSRTEELRTKVVDSLSDAPSNSIPRGPHLLSVELAAVGIRGIVNTATSSSSPEITTTTVAAQEVDEEKAIALQKEIRAYGELFSTRASCAFSDLFPYLEVLSGASKDVLLSLLEWSNSIRSELCSEKCAQADGSDDAPLKERKARLRGYIFAVKVSYKVVEMLRSNEDDLVGWQELATEWKVATALSSTAKEESENSENSEVQKENQPGDDLILLAVQQLLFRFPKDKAMLVVAATLAEAGIEHSPYNAYLKITAMDVYSRCNATSRAWELYQKMTIKHIQLDSCSYLILPLLVDGGLYNESVLESNHVVKLHGSTAKDTGEYMARAMEQGTLSKANEFLLFQRERMNTSLSLLDAKGRIMDCAPLVHFGTKTRGAPKPIAAQHGIVGAETDLERAANMVKETHNHYGAPSILTSPVLSRSVDHYRDNRDLTIISHQILNQNRIVSKDQIVSESKRRGHVHGFLIRSVLCVDACKGPKKGKVQKSSDTLKDRCNSLIDAANSAETFIKEEYVSAAIDGYSQLFEAMLIMLRVLGIVSAGMPLQPGETDSLSVREQRVSELLLQGTAVLEDAKVKMDLESDPEWTNEKIRIACRLLPDCVVPLFAMLEMNGNLFTTFGWGKRKRFTKNGAAALADFALSFRAFILSMKGALLCLPDDLDDKNLKAKEVATDVGPFVESGHLPDDIAKDSIKNLIRGQGVTRDRVVPFLDYVVIALDAFDIKEES